MKKTFLKNSALFLLALVFSLALMFAFTELPALLDRVLQDNIGFPGFDHGQDEQHKSMMYMYISALNLRLIGYISLAVIAVLIVLGFLTRKSGWAWAGALALFLPVFGQFALSMFFLAGLGILRTGWLPFLDISDQILNLGQVAFLPFRILIWFFGLFNWYAKDFLAWFFMGLGAFLFVWGVLVWFQTRFSKAGVATGWIYRISRHPQYLGWIIWSYGFVIFSSGINQMKKSWGFSSSLSWLLMTMIIIGICMLEEIRMKNSHGTEYEKYRDNTPFLFPLPKWLIRFLKVPQRWITGKPRPEKRREVAWIILLYTGILMGLSLFWVDFSGGSASAGRLVTAETPRETIDSLLAKIDRTKVRRDVYKYFDGLGSMGEAAAGPLIGLLNHEWEVNREFAALELGKIKSGPAIGPLVRTLKDTVGRVRNEAAWALGEIGSHESIDPLMACLTQDTLPVSRSAVYTALGKTGSEKALDVLVMGLEDESWWTRSTALGALNKVDPSGTLEYVHQSLNDAHQRVRLKAVMILMEYGTPESIPYLEKVLDDEDFETRFYAGLAIKKLRTVLTAI